APPAISSRGRCAAIAVATNQVIANTSASRTVARAPALSPAGASAPGRASEADAPVFASAVAASAVAGAGRRALGNEALSGRPTNRCRPAQAKQAPRQPNSASSRVVSGQPTVLAKPAIKVMPVDRKSTRL